MDHKDDPSGDEYSPRCFEDTLAEELAEVWKRRKKLGHCAGDEPSGSSTDKGGVIEKAHRARLLGLAFSGGGIRSATFNLGVLQALAQLRVLDHVDYLSTVSGGGYIGSWFAAWVRRRDEDGRRERQQSKSTSSASKTTSREAQPSCNGFRKVIDELKPEVGTDLPDRDPGALQPDPGPIRHLREYSNYLTPRRGLWSTDAWTIGVTYLRNLLLTLSVLLGTVFAVVLLTAGLASGFFNAASLGPGPTDTVVALLFCTFLFISSLILGMELTAAPTGPGKDQPKTARTSPLSWAAFATILAAVVGLLWLWRNHQALTGGWLEVVRPTLVIMASSFAGGLVGRWAAARRGRMVSTAQLARILVAGLLALAALTGLLYLLGLWMPAKPVIGPGLNTWMHWNAVVWGAPLVTLTFALSTTVFVGLSGRDLTELDRELLARYFGVIAKWTLLFTGLLVFVVYAYPLISWVNTNMSGVTESHLTAGNVWGTLTTVWGALSAVGAWLASSKETTGGAWSRWLKRIVIMLSPYVFIAGLFVFGVWAAHALMDLAITESQWLESLDPATTLECAIAYSTYWDRMESGYWRLLLGASAVVAVITIVWSRRIGVNTFSLHALYGNRLVRAYLGASNLDRCAHPFHGFDEGDNVVHMQDLVADCYSGPIPIINSAINLVSSRRLAWQQRKAASFTFTPLYAGYEFYGEEDPENRSGWLPRTGGYISSRLYGGRKGVSLGRALTISGAAASPNMGYHSSPGLTFLMTTFNLRLGWWLPNPGRRLRSDGILKRLSGWRRELDRGRLRSNGPYFGLLYLLMELFGKTSARSRYVYLSDGGHFENLGIYELVRRRCRFIIACDAEADPEMGFAGLGNAVEKCRTDLGVPITIDVSQIRPEVANGLSRWHCAVGCIRYSEADPGQPDGTILYIKASRTGGEPQDVQTYATRHASFPHETTADQWFNESQFESYRALGEHSAMKVLRTAVRVARQAGAEDKGRMKERLFLELRKQWYPHCGGARPEPADHDALLHGLLDTMREDRRLSFLDGQLYPNLVRITDAHRKHGLVSHPANYDEFRAGFFFCKRLIQFMQQVFHDQRLDTEYSAPSNRGWMNLFRRWSWSRMFRFTWTVTAGTYSARFQSFCENQLGLAPGDPYFSNEPMYLRVRIDIPGGEPTIEVLAERNGKAVDWEQGNAAVALDGYEHRLIEEFIGAYVRREEFRAVEPAALEFEVYALRVDTEDPNKEEEDVSTTLSAGFLIVGPTTQQPRDSSALLYFRIRSSMRNMDLARKAFLSMKDHSRLAQIEPAIVEELPKVDETGKAPWQRRAYHEVHIMEREDLDRCRWFSQLLEDFERETPQTQADDPGTNQEDCRQLE